MIEISEKHREKLLEKIDLIKDNLSLFILIPTFLGGLQQIIQLISISPALIRFFSLSQLVTDGLFIVLYLITVALIPLLIAKKMMSALKKYINSSVWNVISFILITLYILHLLLTIYWNDLFRLNPLLDFLSQFIMFFFAGCSIYLPHSDIVSTSESFKSFKNRMNLFMVIFLLFFGISLASFMFKKITDTIPIDNFELLEKKYEKLGKIKILYFNDKYIFIQINSKNKAEDKIHIEKLESIFN